MNWSERLCKKKEGIFPLTIKENTLQRINNNVLVLGKGALGFPVLVFVVVCVFPVFEHLVFGSHQNYYSGSSTKRSAKRLGKLVRYIEEKQPRCSLYRGMVNNCPFFVV